MPVVDDFTIDYVDKKVYHQEFIASLAIAEVSTVTINAVASATWNGKYFLLNSASDSAKYYVWFQTDAVGTDPAVAGRIGVLVSLVAASDTTTTLVASKIVTAMTTASSLQVGDFTTTSSTNVVTITNIKKGAVTDIADGAGALALTTALATLAVTTQGSYGEALAEIQEVTVPAAASIVGGDYFNLYSATDATAYAVWYLKAGVGTAPTGKTGI